MLMTSAKIPKMTNF